MSATRPPDRHHHRRAATDLRIDQLFVLAGRAYRDIPGVGEAKFRPQYVCQVGCIGRGTVASVRHLQANAHVIDGSVDKFLLLGRKRVIGSVRLRKNRPVVVHSLRRQGYACAVHLAGVRNLGRGGDVEELKKRRASRRHAPGRIVLRRVVAELVPVCQSPGRPFRQVSDYRSGRRRIGGNRRQAAKSSLVCRRLAGQLRPLLPGAASRRRGGHYSRSASGRRSGACAGLHAFVLRLVVRKHFKTAAHVGKEQRLKRMVLRDFAVVPVDHGHDGLDFRVGRRHDAASAAHGDLVPEELSVAVAALLDGNGRPCFPGERTVPRSPCPGGRKSHVAGYFRGLCRHSQGRRNGQEHPFQQHARRLASASGSSANSFYTHCLSP